MLLLLLQLMLLLLLANSTQTKIITIELSCLFFCRLIGTLSLKSGLTVVVGVKLIVALGCDTPDNTKHSASTNQDKHKSKANKHRPIIDGGRKQAVALALPMKQFKFDTVATNDVESLHSNIQILIARPAERVESLHFERLSWRRIVLGGFELKCKYSFAIRRRHHSNRAKQCNLTRGMGGHTLTTPPPRAFFLLLVDFCLTVPALLSTMTSSPKLKSVDATRKYFAPPDATKPGTTVPGTRRPGSTDFSIH
jgi:hypothetical protein